MYVTCSGNRWLSISIAVFWLIDKVHWILQRKWELLSPFNLLFVWAFLRLSRRSRSWFSTFDGFLFFDLFHSFCKVIFMLLHPINPYFGWLWGVAYLSHFYDLLFLVSMAFSVFRAVIFGLKRIGHRSVDCFFTALSPIFQSTFRFINRYTFVLICCETSNEEIYAADGNFFDSFGPVIDRHTQTIVNIVFAETYNSFSD